MSSRTLRRGKSSAQLPQMSHLVSSRAVTPLFLAKHCLSWSQRASGSGCTGPWPAILNTAQISSSPVLLEPAFAPRPPYGIAIGGRLARPVQDMPAFVIVDQPLHRPRQLFQRLHVQHDDGGGDGEAFEVAQAGWRWRRRTACGRQPRAVPAPRACPARARRRPLVKARVRRARGRARAPPRDGQLIALSFPLPPCPTGLAAVCGVGGKASTANRVSGHA